MLRVLTSEEVETYRTDGFLLVRNVFEIQKLKAARELFLTAFEKDLWKEAPQSSVSIINDIYHYFPEVMPAVFPKKFFDVLKDLLGEHLVWIPECSIHRNRYIHWHKDTSIQEFRGELSHQNYEHPLVQAAIYFQENDPETGGGLTLMPATHAMPDKYAHMLTSSFAKKSFFKLLKMFRRSEFDKSERGHKVDADTRMGDLLLFDLRINHRSTGAKSNKNLVDKLAIFNTFCLNNSTSEGYFHFMKNRPEPYYRYFQELPLPDVVYQKAAENQVSIWY
jgi:hypothetical protein